MYPDLVMLLQNYLKNRERERVGEREKDKFDHIPSHYFLLRHIIVTVKIQFQKKGDQATNNVSTFAFKIAKFIGPKKYHFVFLNSSIV